MSRRKLLPVLILAPTLAVLSCGGGDDTPTGPGTGPSDPPPAGNIEPTASFTVSADEGTAPVDITFNAAGSSDSDGTIASYAWTFGDGGSGSGAQATHTFTAVGMFYIELTVTDDRGGSDSVRRAVFVGSPPGSGTNTIQGSIWWDDDLNGAEDGGEKPLDRFIVFLDEDDDAEHDPSELLTFSDASGDYSFTGLDGAATYTVTQALPFGWTNTTPGLPSPSPTSAVSAGPGAGPTHDGPALIINGDFASIDDFPFQVALMVGNFQFCGGTFINSKWVMTAAHCMVGTLPSDFEVLYDTDDLTIGGQRVSVSAIRVPDDWGGATADWDIALLRLSENVLRPRPFIHSPDEPEITEPGDTAVTIGWGQLETGEQPNELRRVAFPIVDLKTCGESAGFLFGSIGDGAICAGEPAGGVGACFGDSGGPLLVWSGEAWVQVGITSRGAALDDCGDIPSVYARVSFMYDYITSVAQIEDSGSYVVDWSAGPTFQADFGNFH
jgi:trypsin